MRDYLFAAAALAWSARLLARAVLPALLLAACGTSPPLPDRPDIPFGEGRLWQVERPGLPTSYLFGTRHDSDKRVLALPQAVETAFAKATIAAFEIVGDDDPTAEQRAAFLQLPAGRSLVDVVGAEIYRELRSVLSTQHLSVSVFDRVQPWVVWSSIASREISIGRHEPSGQPVLDDLLEQRAKEAGKEVIGLETIDEQLQIFGGIPLDDQASMLRSAMAVYYDPRSRVDRIESYLDGDLALSYALWQRMLEPMDPAVAQRFNERLITGRNRIMVERLLPLVARGSTFVAVGAGHMAGEEGMLHLLELEGFTVTRLH